jgi:hypothetical protein
MAMNFDSIEYRQKIVYVGLSRMTEDRSTIQRAFTFWHKKLSSREFKVSEIVAYMEKYIGLTSGEKKSLYVAMQAAATRLEQELPAVPGFLLDDEPAANKDAKVNDVKQAANKKASTAHRALVQHMLRSLSQYINKRHGDYFSDLVEAIQEEGLTDTNADIKSSVDTWADGGLAKLELPTMVSEQECGEIFRNFCDLTTEFIGPVNTDRLVNLVISEALDLEEASRFDPRDLL